LELSELKLYRKPGGTKQGGTKSISNYFHKGSQARRQVDESNITTLHILTLNHSYAYRTSELTIRLCPTPPPV